MKRTIAALAMLCTLTMLFACGGGGGDGTPGGGKSTQPTTAVLKLTASGTSAAINGIDVTVDLPAGVTLKDDTNPPQTDSGVVALSGGAANAYYTAVYTVATANAPGKVRILIAAANGFSVGEFCSVTGNIAAGYTPKATDFSIASFAASDQNGAVISGLSAAIAATIQ